MEAGAIKQIAIKRLSDGKNEKGKGKQ